MFYPSQLDSEEINLIRSSLRRSLLQFGLRSGVFYLEARVRNSSKRYRESDGNLDLISDNAGLIAKSCPEIFLKNQC